MAAVVLLLSELALAQDPSAASVKPNVLLVIDTSGSMEYKTEYTDFNSRFPVCNPGSPGLVNEKSRWIEVLEILTGDIDDAVYSCEAVSRSTSSFSAEFAMPSGQNPPDFDFGNPYHRPISNNCVWSPDTNTTLSNAFDWVPPVEMSYPVALSSLPGCIGTSCCNFTQSVGFIDSFGDLARFGLMTFDPLADEARGYATSTYAPQYLDGVQGAWSYYDERSGNDDDADGQAYAQGRPAGCGYDQTLEVGVRNAAAPSSEGKMIYFGDPDSDSTADDQRHDRIEKVLLATRPYGATPLNGALADVRHFFWGDEDLDPLEPTPGLAPDLHISPQFDDRVECGCRKQHVILITDGEPNFDMRPSCADDGAASGLSAGRCPFEDDPEAILTDLYNQEDDRTQQSCTTPSTAQNKSQIPTHVIGFATSTYDIGEGVKDCADLPTDEPDWNTSSGVCNAPTNADLKVCCTLHELASAGSGGNEEPHIAPTAAELESALASIISGLVSASATATRPVRSPGIGKAQDPSEQIAFRILTSYEVDTGTSGLWRGNIERMRWTCEGTAPGVPTEQEKKTTLGDDFSYTVAANEASREFYTVYPSGAPEAADGNIRPYYVSSNPADGAGAITSTTERAAVGSSFATAVDAEALKLTSVTYAGEAACQLDSVTPNEDKCSERVLNWTLGYADDTGRDRCANAGDQKNCSLIGHVMHSAPVIVDRPKAAVEDETYERFSQENAGRMMMMYVSSNDGILHGFAVSPNDASDDAIMDTSYNNEHFAFIPPFVLSQLKNQYPDVPGKLLDSTAVVQDVVATEPGHTSGYGYKLERSLTDTTSRANTWRTILVQGFGGQQSGYFALDVTDARKRSANTDAGPRFLWQLSQTSSGNRLFGKGGTPIITTLNVNGKEVAVAVLPGGYGGSPTGQVNRSDSQLVAGTFPNPNVYYDSADSGGPLTGGYPGQPRSQITQYSSADAAANSLTIVRLDNGEILRTFWNVAPAELSAVDGNAPSYLDSPITGIPAAFPAGTGMIADRIFVGDQDGVMWRVDVSDPDPADWTMRMFFDSYAAEGARDGKPITIQPVLSVTETGQVTVAYATGAQDLSGGSTDIQYIYSLTEAEKGAAFYSKVNWWQRLTTGEHILGPMSLTNQTLYFSTLAPSSSDVCSPYPSNIWGVDYLEPLDGNPELGGVARFPSAASPTGYAQFVEAQSLVTGSDTVGPVFGVSLEYSPTCRTPATEVDVSYIAGKRSQVGASSGSNLQLVFQTGTVKTSKEGLKFATGFEAVTLPQPRVPSTLLSWAAILD